jgi:alpha-L-fucosidase
MPDRIACRIVLVLLFFVQIFASGQVPIPSKEQLEWHDQEFYLFIHFGPNTFTDVEWGHGKEKVSVFNPLSLDCRQWCETAVKAGATGIIITAKHHDGFCLWPSKYSSHTVAQSSWKAGKGDVLKELSEACLQYGLKFGVYISPWDRNHPSYGTPAYNDVFVNMMEEIFDSYGPIWELWWDGANGEGPNGKKQVYDWGKFRKFVNEKSPSTLVFSDVGPHIRWVGNEKGIAGITNYNFLDTAGFSAGEAGPPLDTLNQGNKFGKSWIPAECDVSIRPGWFYHQEEDSKVKSSAELFSLYLKSVGRGSNLLLNVPPDKRGLMHALDSASLVGFRALLNRQFADNILMGQQVMAVTDNSGGGHAADYSQLLTDGNGGTNLTMKGKKVNYLSFFLGQPRDINCVVLMEDLSKGQAVESGYVRIYDENGINVTSIPFTTMGRKRILTWKTTKNVSRITVEIRQARQNPIIREVSAYLIDDVLIGNL